MSPLESVRAAIAERESKRDALHGEQTAMVAETDKRDNKAMTEDETKVYNEKRDAKLALDTELVELRKDEAAYVEEERRDALHVEARRKLGVDPSKAVTTSVTEPDIYRADMFRAGQAGGQSYFRDLARATLFGDAEARDRLTRHAAFEIEKRALGNTGAVGGSGGEFAPPDWMVGEFSKFLRAGRVTADLYNKSDIPAGVSSLNLPTITGGTSTAVQTTQNTALSQTDMTTSFVQTGWATIGGKQVVSQQLLDQSAIPFDRVVLGDLAADYANRVGVQTFAGTGNGSGTGSVVNGLNNATFGNTQTWTQASPTAAGFYGQASALISKFLTSRFMPPTCWVMHPRRWYWLVSQVDSTGRPLVVPTGPAQNQSATVEGDPAAAQGYVGTFHGLPVYIDPNVPINIGSGTNQDNVYLLKTDDLWLFESSPRAEAFRETYADSVGVLFRMYAYVGTMLNRHTQSLGVITGTGLVTPTFAS